MGLVGLPPARSHKINSIFRLPREAIMYAQTRFPPVGPPPGSPAIGLVILTLLCQRLLDALPVTDSAVWMINDALSAVSFAALIWLAYLLTLLAWRWREDYRVR